MKYNIRHEFVDIFRDLRPTTPPASIARPLIERYSDPESKERVDAVYLIYNEFKNVMQQDVVVEQTPADREARVRKTRRGARLHLRAHRGGDL